MLCPRFQNTRSFAFSRHTDIVYSKRLVSRKRLKRLIIEIGMSIRIANNCIPIVVLPLSHNRRRSRIQIMYQKAWRSSYCNGSRLASAGAAAWLVQVQQLASVRCSSFALSSARHPATPKVQSAVAFAHVLNCSIGVSGVFWSLTW
jgi:hypothetical protein